MATKIVPRDEFVAPDDMADIDYRPSWDEMEAPDSAMALDVVPDVERDYFNARRIAKLEALAAKRTSQAKHWDRAHTPEFELLSEVGNELNMTGAHSVMLEYRPGHAPVLTAGATNRYQLARVNGESATVYAKHTVSRMTPRGQDTTTQIIGYAVEAATLIESIRALAPARVPLRQFEQTIWQITRPVIDANNHQIGEVVELAMTRTVVRGKSALRVETGKASRKKWQANQSRKNSHDTGVERDMLRNDKQRAMYAMRESIAERVARGEQVLTADWKVALGRKLTDTESKAARRYNADHAAGSAYAKHDGMGTAMSRLVNSLERK